MNDIQMPHLFSRPFMSSRSADAFASLRIKEFRNFQLARFLFTISMQMQGTIVGWRVYEITRDELALGLIGLSEALPFISVSLYSGLIADRYSRRKIMLICTAVMWLCCCVLGMLIVFPHLFSFEGAYPFYMVIGITGLARSFLAPSSSAIQAQILPRHLYANGAAWGSNMWQTGAVAGPAIGGLIYGYGGAMPAYIIILILMAMAGALFFTVGEKPVSQSAHEPAIKALKDGLNFVFKRQAIWGALSLDMFAVLFGGATALLPVYCKEILHVGPQGFGFLNAAPFVGSLMMGFVLAYRPPMANAGKYLLGSVALFGISIIIFGISKNYYLSFFFLMMSGIFDSVSVVVRHTILQTLTPDDMRGRVSAVNGIFISSSNEIGAFESGVAARIMGLVPSVVFGGSMTVLIVMLVGWRAPKLRKLSL